MPLPLFSIGDKVKRTDIQDKIHTIEKVKFHRGGYIYSCEGQGFAQGWAWVQEEHIKKEDVK